METLVEFKEVSAHRGGVAVLESLSFALKPGEFVSIVGPNGAGKTSAIKLILGGLSPSRGRVLVLGRDASVVKNAQLAPFVGYVPQNCSPNSAVEVFEFIKMSFLASSGFRAIGRSCDGPIESALRSLRIENLADKELGVLSGGEMQKVLIAAAIAHKPKIILLDEPTTSLDPGARNEIISVLQGIGASTDAAVLLVSHDLDAVSRLSRRVIGLKSGRKIFDGEYSAAAVEHIFSSEPGEGSNLAA